MRDVCSVRESLSELAADALLVTNPANVRYLSGFTTPKDARVLITEADAILFTDGRYTAQAQEESRLSLETTPADWLGHIADKVKDMRLAFESDSLTYAQVETLRSKLNCPVVPTADLIKNLRLTKTPLEIATLREAARITDAAFEHILGFMRAGLSEVEVALELERFMRLNGAEAKSFEIIVASGVRSAMPHGVASNKVIEKGDLVTLDFGARVDGYHADMTRAVAIGDINDDLRLWFDTVLAAQKTALEALAPEKNGQDIDALARKVLASQGLEEAFAHGLGHGVGLEIHEKPRVARDTEVILKPGMTVTIEPGVYFPGRGGVRIEDLTVITETGYERLSQSSKEFVKV